MSTPVLLAIVLNMQAALQSISTAGGYFYDLKASSVVTNPVPLEPINPNDVPFLCVGHLIDAVGERLFATSKPNAIKDRWRITIEGRVDAATADANDWLTSFARITADIEKALLVDPQRNSLALYTYVMQPQPFFGTVDRSQVFFQQPVDILLRREYGVP